MLDKIISGKTRRQLAKYATVGFVGAVINISITTLLCGLFPIHFYVTIFGVNLDFWVAFFNGVGVLTAFLFNFYFNKKWTFKC